MTYIVRAYQSVDGRNDDENNECDGYHDVERFNPFTGGWSLYTVPCHCNIVPVGIVQRIRPFAVRTTSSADADDLPF